MDIKKENDEGKKIKATVGISFFTCLLVVIGLGLFALSFIDLDSSKYDILNKVADPYESITRNIGLTLFSAGLVSVLIEVSTITSVVKNSVMKIVTEDFPFENFSRDRLNEINKQLVVKRCRTEKMSVQSLNNSVYALENKLLEASEGLYYDYNKATYIINHDSKKGVFNKRAEFEFKIINKYALDNRIHFTVSIIHSTDTLSKDELKDKFHMIKFEIKYGEKNNSVDGGIVLNENQVNQYLDIMSIEGEAHSLYKYQVSFEYELSKCLWNEVKMIYEYEIPDYDIIQSYKLNLPSKELEHTVIIKADREEHKSWEIAGDAYTAFYFPSSDGNYQVVQKVPDTIRISFRDWAIIGAGYMVTFLHK